MAASSRRSFWITGRIPGLVSGRESALTRSGEPVEKKMTEAPEPEDKLDAATTVVVGQAAGVLGERADEVLEGPRATLGPPWTKDHRIALAATIVAG